jgi:UDP-N-acetylmuramate-alanine ligase
MELENIKRVYLIGIGGIGMSGLARYFKKRGCVVCGYDKTITPLTTAMRNEGISVVYQDEEDNLKISFLENDPETLIFSSLVAFRLKSVRRFWVLSAKGCIPLRLQVLMEKLQPPVSLLMY